MPLINRKSVLMLVFTGWASGLLASELAVAEATELPSLDLLEYLGMMVEQGDELIGPEDLTLEDIVTEPEPFPDSIVVDDLPSSIEEDSYRD